MFRTTMAVLTAASGSAPEQADDATEAASEDGDGASPTSLEGQTISKRPGFLGDETVLSWVSSLFRRNGNGSEEISKRE